jgi:hypothetical protein
MATQHGELAFAFLLFPRKISTCLNAGWQQSWPSLKTRKYRPEKRELRLMTGILAFLDLPATGSGHRSGARTRRRTEHDNQRSARGDEYAARIVIPNNRSWLRPGRRNIKKAGPRVADYSGDYPRHRCYFNSEPSASTQRSERSIGGGLASLTSCTSSVTPLQ